MRAILRLIFTRLRRISRRRSGCSIPRARASPPIRRVQKAASAAYLIVVSPGTATAETGSFTVAYQRPNNPCSPVALTCGQTTLRWSIWPANGHLHVQRHGGRPDHLRLASRSGAVEFTMPRERAFYQFNGLLRSVLTADGVYTCWSATAPRSA
jgi:hypothetical protein